MIILTKPCGYCGCQSELEVDQQQYENWKNGMLAQNAFPDMDKEVREMLISGTHPDCWNELFGEIGDLLNENEENEEDEDDC